MVGKWSGSHYSPTRPSATSNFSLLSLASSLLRLVLKARLLDLDLADEFTEKAEGAGVTRESARPKLVARLLDSWGANEEPWGRERRRTRKARVMESIVVILVAARRWNLRFF